MKKFFILICLFALFQTLGLKTQAIIITAQNSTTTAINTYTPYYQYLKYYIIDNGRMQLTFKKLSQEDDKNFENSLSKEEKQNYRYTKKIQQLIEKGAWGEVLYKYPDFYPALVQYYNNCKEKNLYEEALRTMDKLRMADRNYQIFSKDIINKELSSLYIQNKQYQKALDVLKLYEATNSDKIYSSMAVCYYGINDGNNALKYLNKIRNKQYEDNELIYQIYLDKNDLPNAHKAAINLTNQKYNYTNLMRVQQTSLNENDSLKYAYQARNTTNNEADIRIVNKIIADIEQKRLDKKISVLRQFIKLQKWSDILKQLPDNLTAAELSTKQDEYFKTANEYLIRYDGQNLTNAFYSLNQDYINYIADKKNEYYRQKEAEAQQAMLEAKERQNYINQQIIQQQQMQNYIRMQRIRYMGRPEYYSNPMFYDPWW